MRDFLILVAVFLGVPTLWQLPRTFWIVRAKSDGSRFKGLYCRYKIATVTGHVSNISDSSSSVTVGNVHATGTVIGGTVSVSAYDGRRTFTTNYRSFHLTDANGAAHAFVAANVSPSIGHGDLVSAATLVHNGKSGNTFVVYNHTTNTYYVELTRCGNKNAKRGLITMVLRLPQWYIAILCLGIVTIPLVAVYGLGAMFQVWLFRKAGIKPLIRKMEAAAAAMPAPRPAPQAAVTAPLQAAPDLATQVQHITDLHTSGALSTEEFQAAKAKLLGVAPAATIAATSAGPSGESAVTSSPAPDRNVVPSVTWSEDRQYWWGGAAWMPATTSVPPGAPVSDDRNYWWDGESWREMPKV